MAGSTARNNAIKQLGKEDDYINLAGYNLERENARENYDLNYNALQDKYNNLVDTINSNKASAKNDFTTNRVSLDNNSYMSNRGVTGADLSSRGLSSGFGNAGRLANVLQRNNANSQLANTYYDAMGRLQKDLDIGTNEHNYNLDSLRLELDKNIADIGAREAERRNAYRTAVANLAEQIQARYDANAYAKKQYELQVKQANLEAQARLASQYATDVLNKETSYDLSRYLIDEANRVAAGGGAVLRDGTRVTNNQQALKWLEEQGRFRLKDLTDMNKAEQEAAKKKTTTTKKAKAVGRNPHNAKWNSKIRFRR